MHIVTVVGARPQFVKAAVLSRLIRSAAYRERISEFLVHTGQHWDDNMSNLFFREMGIPEPEVNLGVGGGSHGRMTGDMLAGIEAILIERKPDVVLVYGDTNSTLAGALAAAKLHIPVAHVEAGLRSRDKGMPEEQNRIVADHLSTWLLCPTETAIENLSREGLVDGQATAAPTSDHPGIKLVGDVMYDASLHYRAIASVRPAAERALKRLGIDKPFCLLTLHRAENTDDRERLSGIMEGLRRSAGIPMIFPVHPRTRKLLDLHGITLPPHVRPIEPVGYFDMLELEEACDTVITDSGGVQKEAYFFHKPCVTLRERTEWVETVESGWNRLAGADPGAIAAALTTVSAMDGWRPLYGMGDAGERILAVLETGSDAKSGNGA
ncbi:MAG: UDP-N-acetylglucosamine 2-epimerase (non-hydrolyzing) [Spirochaetes bacterium]|nr:UDP-N-acetylglucosamine 2-epimerase (non-hydrolyzing) [Spirochaetota bacterium]